MLKPAARRATKRVPPSARARRTAPPELVVDEGADRRVARREADVVAVEAGLEEVELVAAAFRGGAEVALVIGLGAEDGDAHGLQGSDERAGIAPGPSRRPGRPSACRPGAADDLRRYWISYWMKTLMLSSTWPGRTGVVGTAAAAAMSIAARSM